MKRLVGYDLNGWSDFSARNWLEVPGQETLENQDQVVQGGIGSVVVAVQESPQGTEFIGGMQAQRAPHGRGACVFRSIRPPIPTTSAHLFRSIRPPVMRCCEAAFFSYQV